METDDNKKDTITNGTCGGAALVAKKVEVDIINDNTDRLAQNDTRVVGEEAKSEGSTPAKIVRTHTLEITEEFHEVDSSDTRLAGQQGISQGRSASINQLIHYAM